MAAPSTTPTGSFPSPRPANPHLSGGPRTRTPAPLPSEKAHGRLPRLPAAPPPSGGPAAYPGSPAAARPGRAPASRSAPLSRRLRAAIAAAAAIFPGAADVAHEGAGSRGSALPFLKMAPAWLRARPPAPPRCQHQPWRP